MFLGIESFSDFPKAERELLEDVFVRERFPRGHVFVREGDLARSSRDAICVVLEGEVAVTRAGGAVRAVLVRGDLFGIVSMCTEHPRSATCTAATDVTVAHLDKPAITYLRSEHTALAARFELLLARQLVRDLRALTRVLCDAVESGDSGALMTAFRAV